ncbi:hypothetical protein CRG98_007918 [Punica granatum]|uniref:Uncharacterized protein n=1 Tax=Punica granatum TaxID=22663 RepID=A0A2I0KV14_PUNGR|nr:hypothetical protein CRG98_007918 [Punica granatum]
MYYGVKFSVNLDGIEVTKSVDDPNRRDGAGDPNQGWWPESRIPTPKIGRTLKFGILPISASGATILAITTLLPPPIGIIGILIGLDSVRINKKFDVVLELLSN